MKKIFVLASVLLVPAFAYAAEPLGNLSRLVSQLGRIVEQLIPIVFGIAVVVFFWGLAKYILAAGSEESKAEGRRIMIGGIIALFIMASIWGIVRFIGESLGVDDTHTQIVPMIQ